MHCIRCDCLMWPWQGLYCKACEEDIERERKRFWKGFAAEVARIVVEYGLAPKDSYVQPK